MSLITPTLVMYLLYGLAAFSLFWAVERFIYFFGKRSSLMVASRKHGTAAFGSVMAKAGRDLDCASRIASALEVQHLGLDLLRRSGGDANLLRELAEGEHRDACRFGTFMRQAYGIGTSIGILGTVSALVETLTSGAQMDGNLSMHIGSAMRATVLGLVIGLVVTYGLGNLFGRWTRALAGDIEAVVAHYATKPPADSAGAK